MKNLLGRINSIFDTTGKKQYIELQDTTKETSQNETQEKNLRGKKEQNRALMTCAMI